MSLFKLEPEQSEDNNISNYNLLNLPEAFYTSVIFKCINIRIKVTRPIINSVINSIIRDIRNRTKRGN